MNKIYIAIIAFGITFLSSANTITVTNTNDAGAGSLRQAITDAFTGDTINFNVSGTILVNSYLPISKNITIEGPGASILALDGGNATRIFEDDLSTFNTVTISGLEIRNGNSSSYGGAIQGDGIELTIDNCFMHDNYTGLYGGAICIFSYYFGPPWNELSTLNINESNITNNSSGSYAGGVAIMGGGMQDETCVFNINNSTFSNNTSGSHGGCFYISFIELADLNFTNSTFYNNSCAPTYFGALIFANFEVQMDLMHCTVAGHSQGADVIDLNFNPPFMIGDPNPSTLELTNCILDNPIFNIYEYAPLSAPITSQGGNISNDNTLTTWLAWAGDLNNTSAQLDPTGLNMNGGSTPTLSINCNSPAYNNAFNNIVSTDQRGELRIGIHDAGAYEFSPNIYTAETACDSYTWAQNSATYTLTGQYIGSTYSDINGCDSIPVLNLTINNSTISSITETGLDIYTAPSGATFTSSGIYTDIIPNAAGCDSVITIDLTMNFTGLNEHELGNVNVYPNPSSKEITIYISETLLGNPLAIKDQYGRVVYESNTNEINTILNIEKLQSGLYYLKVGETKSLKFVKQ